MDAKHDLSLRDVQHEEADLLKIMERAQAITNRIEFGVLNYSYY